MDVISHGLWGGVAFGRKSRRAFWWSFSFGIMPDMASFGVFSFMNILGLVSGPDWSKGPPPMSSIPNYVHALYDVTHSLFVFAMVFLGFYVITKRWFLPMLAWLLHILIDIPTHSAEFFPTPFLWPISEYRFDGIGWGEAYIFFPNYAVLAALYLYFFVYKRFKRD